MLKSDKKDGEKSLSKDNDSKKSESTEDKLKIIEDI